MLSELLGAGVMCLIGVLCAIGTLGHVLVAHRRATHIERMEEIQTRRELAQLNAGP